MEMAIFNVYDPCFQSLVTSYEIYGGSSAIATGVPSSFHNLRVVQYNNKHSKLKRRNMLFERIVHGRLNGSWKYYRLWLTIKSRFNH